MKINALTYRDMQIAKLYSSREQGQESQVSVVKRNLAPFTYNGASYSEVTILTFPFTLWDNVRREALKRPFCTKEELIDLYAYSKNAYGGECVMPLETLEAFCMICNEWFAGPKIITYNALHMPEVLLSSKCSVSMGTRIDGIISQVFKSFADRRAVYTK